MTQLDEQRFTESGIGLEMALALTKSGKPDDAEAILRALPQDDARVLYNLGWHDIRHGNLLKGFEGLNTGRFIDAFGSEPIPGEIWRNQPLDGKTLLFRMEGGLGDEIINFRFAQYFRTLGATVIIAGHPSLSPIFSAHGFACVAPGGIQFTYYDYWVPAMSAAFMLGLEHYDIPGSAYLTAKPVSKPGKRPRIGLRWGGNVGTTDIEPQRKVDAESLTALSESVDADFFSFQRDADLVDVNFMDLRDSLKDWGATASWLMAMDVVVTSCTSVAHMAAALGVETWVLVPIMPYYTWAVPGESSVWYDSVRLFRQTVPGDWSEPIAQVRKALLERFP